MKTNKKVSVLCCSKTSYYKTLPGVDAFDINRNASTFKGNNPIVAHPPCRSWSAKMSHFAKPLPGERDLAHFCISKLKTNGGVLEHPAYSKLFSVGSIPKPGEGRKGDLISIEVWQSWFGYVIPKKTWLCFSKIDLNKIILPFSLISQGGHGSRFDNMSQKQRSHSLPGFADFLVNSARAVQC